MTTTLEASPPDQTTEAAEGGPSRRRSRRWVRGVAPFAVVFALFLGSTITWWADHWSPSDPAYLSPIGEAPQGSRTLAERLAARGVEVTRFTDTADALDAASGGDATLFVPAPGYVWPAYLERLAGLRTTVVLVMPGQRTLRLAGVPVDLGAERWATGLASPGCDHPAARAAGAATVLRQRYAAAGAPLRHRCYDGALVTSSVDGTRFEVVGAADPFTDERISEAGNAELAVGLLSDHDRVAWLDLHRPEQPPAPSATPVPGGVETPYSPVPGGTGGEPTSGTGGVPGGGTGDGTPGDGEGTGEGGTGSGGGDGGTSGSEDGGGDEGAGESNPLLTAFPPWLWAVLLQLLLAAVLYGLWRARRLGAPVAEPLPIVVRSAETVEGRARLYQRVHARRAAMTALRTGALRRLAPALDLAPDASEDTVVEAVTARSGWPADQVREVLYGPRPADDDTLVRRANALDALVAAVLDPKGTLQ